MNEHDPVDDLLAAAFRRDIQAVRAPAIADAVISRIRTRRRLRGLLLSAAAAAGMALALAGLMPLLDRMVAGLLVADLSNPSLLVLLAVLGAGSMLVLAEEAL